MRLAFVILVLLCIMATLDGDSAQYRTYLKRHHIEAHGRDTFSSFEWEGKLLHALASKDSEKVHQLLAEYKPERASAKTFEEAGVHNLKLDLDAWASRLLVTSFVRVFKEHCLPFTIVIGYGNGAGPVPYSPSIQQQQKHLGMLFYGVINGNIQVFVPEALFMALYNVLNEPARPYRGPGIGPRHQLISRSLSDWLPMLSKACSALPVGLSLAVSSYGCKTHFSSLTSDDSATNAEDLCFLEEEGVDDSVPCLVSLQVPPSLSFVFHLFDASIVYRYAIGATSTNPQDTFFYHFGYDCNCSPNSEKGHTVYTLSNVVQTLPSLALAYQANEGVLDHDFPVTPGVFGTVTLTGSALEYALNSNSIDGLDHVPVIMHHNSSTLYKSMSLGEPGIGNNEGATKLVVYNNHPKHVWSNHQSNPAGWGHPKSKNGNKGYQPTGVKGAREAHAGCTSMLEDIRRSHKDFPGQWGFGPRFELSIVKCGGGSGSSLVHFKKYVEAVHRLKNSEKSGVYVCAQVVSTKYAGLISVLTLFYFYYHQVEPCVIFEIAQSLLSMAKDDIPANMGVRVQEIMNVLGWSEAVHREARSMSRRGISVLRAMVRARVIGSGLVDVEASPLEDQLDREDLLGLVVRTPRVPDVTEDKLKTCVEFLSRFPSLNGLDESAVNAVVVNFRQDFPYENQSNEVSQHLVPQPRNVTLIPESNPPIYVCCPEMAVGTGVVKLVTAVGPHQVATASSEVFITLTKHFNRVSKLSRIALKRLRSLGNQGPLFKTKATRMCIKRREPPNPVIDFCLVVTSMPFVRFILDPLIKKFDMMVRAIEIALVELHVHSMSEAEKVMHLRTFMAKAARADEIWMLYRKAVYELLIARYYVKYHVFGEERWTHHFADGACLATTPVTYSEMVSTPQG